MNLLKLKKEFENELTDNILNYWATKAYDPKRQIYYGRIDSDEKPYPESPLSAVFTARILWTFSAAYRIYPTAIYKKLADAAYNILMNAFLDKQNGGIYWSVRPDGIPVDTSKQFYAQSFMIYALSEYFQAFDDGKARETAIGIFGLLDKYGYDPVNGGYFEAKTADWATGTHQILTPAGGNEKKSMNTHLHLMEAFTNLYRIWKDDQLKIRLTEMVDIFINKILNNSNYHFQLFFGAGWNVLSTIISYGHDIEGSWLIYETLEVIGDNALTEKIKPIVVKMAEAAGSEALGKTGGLYNELNGDHWDRNYVWWVQSEAVVGFFNAWQLTGDRKFFKWFEGAWEFIKKHIVDHKNGDWFAQVNFDLSVPKNDKINGWKGPYHNGRMCMEMIRRINMNNK